MHHHHTRWHDLHGWMLRPALAAGLAVLLGGIAGWLAPSFTFITRGPLP